MAKEEELRDAQIAKIKAEEDLFREQLRELKRGTRIVSKVGQGIGVGIVLALAGMALFGPIKETIEAESKLATLNSKIAERSNVDLQQRIEERQKLLEAQEQKYTKNLNQLAEDLKKSNLARDKAILRSEELVKREKDLAEKYGRLAAQQKNSAELFAQANEAKERATQLGVQIAKLRAEAKEAEVQEAEVQTRADVRPLNEYEIRVDYRGTLSPQVKTRLDELGLTYSKGDCAAEIRRITYYQKSSKEAAQLLSTALDAVIPDTRLRLKPGLAGYEKTLWICPY